MKDIRPTTTEYPYKGFFIVKFTDGLFRIRSKDKNGEYWSLKKPASKDLNILKHGIDGIISMNNYSLEECRYTSDHRKKVVKD